MEQLWNHFKTPTCSVCGRKPAYVETSKLGKVTFFYCEECRKTGAEPLYFLQDYIRVLGVQSFNELGHYDLKILKSSCDRLNYDINKFEQDCISGVILNA